MLFDHLALKGSKSSLCQVQLCIKVVPFQKQEFWVPKSQCIHPGVVFACCKTQRASYPSISFFGSPVLTLAALGCAFAFQTTLLGSNSPWRDDQNVLLDHLALKGSKSSLCRIQLDMKVVMFQKQKFLVPKSQCTHLAVVGACCKTHRAS